MYEKASEQRALQEALGTVPRRDLKLNDTFASPPSVFSEPADSPSPLLLAVSELVRSWLDAQNSAPLAQACVRYALTVNTLDERWLDGIFTSAVTYESQSSFELFEGRSKVKRYLAGKVELLRERPELTTRYELGILESGEPCVLGFQSAGAHDHNWLERALVAVTFKVDATGLVERVFLITVVPDPAAATRCELYPGVKEEVFERPLSISKEPEDWSALLFLVMLNDVSSAQECRMVEEANTAFGLFPGSSLRVIKSVEPSEAMGESMHKTLAKLSFVAFPSIALLWLDEILWRHQGLVDCDTLAIAVRACCCLKD